MLLIFIIFLIFGCEAKVSQPPLSTGPAPSQEQAQSQAQQATTPIAPITTQETATQLDINKCGNSICEEPESFESCPSDCTPDSMINKIEITENDLPLITGNSPWAKDRYDSISDNHLDSSIRGLGLIAGRNVGYSSDKALVNQQILIYPVENINKVLDATNPNQVLRWAGSPKDIQELPSPNIGEKSRAFTLFLNNEPYTHYIGFTKKRYYELIMIQGGGGAVADYKLLEEIARKAADKIT